MTLLKNSPLWQVALLGIWLGCGISLPLMRAIAPLPWNFLIWLVIFGEAATFDSVKQIKAPVRVRESKHR